MNFRKAANLFFIVVFIFLTLSCEENIITECKEDHSFTENQIRFSVIQSEVFNVSCALSGCHAGNNPQAKLNLSADISYSNLINVSSLLNPSFMRVKPGDSQNSFLIKMLKNNGQGTSQMPPSGKLRDSIIDSIASWIDNGALNN